MKRIISREEHHKRSESICSWLRKHYHLNRRLIAAEADFAKADAIYEAMAGRTTIPKRNLKAVEDILKLYGYTPVK